MRTGCDRKQNQGVKRRPLGAGAGIRQLCPLLIRQEPHPVPRLLLAADVAHRVAVDQSALFDREGEQVRERRHVAVDGRAAAPRFLRCGDLARLLVLPRLAAREGFDRARVPGFRDRIGGDLGDARAGELLRPLGELKRTGGALHLVEIGQDRLDVVLGERIQARALRGGVRDDPRGSRPRSRPPRLPLLFDWGMSPTQTSGPLLGPAHVRKNPP